MACRPSRARKILAGFLLLAALLFGTNVVWVLVGHGASFTVAGVKIHSILLEFPLIAGVSCGILYLLVIGKRMETVLVLLSLALGLGIAEATLRIIDHPLSKAHVDYATWYRPSVYFGHELIPSFEGIGPLGVPVKINSHGFRDEEHAREKPAGTLRVLGLGDSFTFGWGVSRDESFLEQLEGLLRSRAGQPVEVINIGVPGWGLTQYYRFLKRADLDYSPDIIVLTYFVDDLSGPLDADGIEAPPDSVARQQEVPIKGGVLRHSRAFNFLRSVGNWAREKNCRARLGYLHDPEERRREWSARVNYLMVKLGEQDDIRFKGYLRDYLSEFYRLASAKGSTFVVMLIPDIAQLFHPEAQYINQVLAETTEQMGIPFVDMTTVFESSRDLSTYYLWPQDPHTNARGHQEMADALANLLCASPRSVRFRCKEAE